MRLGAGRGDAIVILRPIQRDGEPADRHDPDQGGEERGAASGHPISVGVPAGPRPSPPVTNPETFGVSRSIAMRADPDRPAPRLVDVVDVRTAR
jgi:hypothetical protein